MLILHKVSDEVCRFINDRCFAQKPICMFKLKYTLLCRSVNMVRILKDATQLLCFMRLKNKS